MDSIISDADFRAIEQVAQKSRGDTNLFRRIMRKTKVVREPKLTGKVVRLNSIVLLWHSILKKVLRFRIVLPDNADLKIRSISVFAPISMAILGLKENDHVRVQLDGIEKELTIINVINE